MGKSGEFERFTVNIFNHIYENIKSYLPINDAIYESFQVLDPGFRFDQGSLRFFRDRLLKRFVRCYLFDNYQTLVEQFTAFTTTKSEDDRKNDFKVLASFMINLIIIPNSNCFVERIFSHVSQIKNDIRNSLDMATVSS